MQETVKQPPAGRRYWKLMLALLLLLALGLVSLIWYQYQATKKPLQDLPVPPLGSGDQALTYSGAIYADEGLHRPLGVAVSPSGDRIYVSESGGERLVRVFNADGEEMGSFAPPDTTVPSRIPLYLAIAPDGRVYLSDRHSAAIFIFSPDGEFLEAFEPKAVPAEEWYPMALAFDQQGNLYVTDVTPDKHRVMVFDAQGALKLEFGREGTAQGQFSYPNGIAVDEEGRIFVADSNNGRVQAFDPQGQLLWVITRGYAKGDLAMPRGIALDKDGHLLVADTSAHVIKAYEISGETPRFLFDAGSFGTGDGQFRFPNAIAFEDGRLYVADRENGRVEIWSY